MDSREMVEVDGGFIPLLIVGAVLLLTSCGNSVNVQIGDGNCNDQNADVKTDSVSNSANIGPGTGNKESVT